MNWWRWAVLWVLTSSLLPAQSAKPAPDWSKLEFLLGNWVADGGSFSFELQLDRRVIVRKNQNSNPRHEDLMTIYPDEQTGKLRAIYFDSEAHVIRYNVQA